MPDDTDTDSSSQPADASASANGQSNGDASVAATTAPAANVTASPATASPVAAAAGSGDAQAATGTPPKRFKVTKQTGETYELESPYSAHAAVDRGETVFDTKNNRDYGEYLKSLDAPPKSVGG